MVEVGNHLVEPFVLQTLASPMTPASPATIILSPSSSTTFAPSPLPATSYLYPGAKVVVGWHAASAEVVTVISVLDQVTFTASLVNAHAAGEQVFGATFSTQTPTDPIFTQQEILGYIAQAQNEFLTKAPLIFQFLPNQQLITGQVYQSMPNSVIELERVAIQTIAPDTITGGGGGIGYGEGPYGGPPGYGGIPGSGTLSTFDIAEISRLAGVVTAILAVPVTSSLWTVGLPVIVQGVVDSSFNSVDNIPFLLTFISDDGLTLQWNQTGPNASSLGGVVAQPVWTRLYEASSLEQLSLNQPWWSAPVGPVTPQFWGED
ncbi:MAG: hypothetical protein OK454_02170, partial [Thaumarchaeota archaeon]|nr:hypothetical protein [Nitrososphaerota archaeon]